MEVESAGGLEAESAEALAVGSQYQGASISLRRGVCAPNP